MAWRTAVRITGSPSLPTSDCSTAPPVLSSKAAHGHCPSGEHQSPGRGVHQQRTGMSQVFVPVSRTELVGDQFIGGLPVRHPQQGLGQAHQRHTLVVMQPELVEERVQHGGSLGRSPDPVHQFRRLLNNLFASGFVQTELFRQPSYQWYFACKFVFVDSIQRAAHLTPVLLGSNAPISPLFRGQFTPRGQRPTLARFRRLRQSAQPPGHRRWRLW